MVRCAHARMHTKKHVKIMNMKSQSVQPCGGEITEQVAGRLGYKTCSRYCPRLRMCMDDNMLCSVERFECMNCGKFLLEK